MACVSRGKDLNLNLFTKSNYNKLHVLLLNNKTFIIEEGMWHGGEVTMWNTCIPYWSAGFKSQLLYFWSSFLLMCASWGQEVMGSSTWNHVAHMRDPDLVLCSAWPNHGYCKILGSQSADGNFLSSSLSICPLSVFQIKLI